MTQKCKNLVYFISLVSLTSPYLFAQKVQVVSKIVEKTIPYKEGTIVKVNTNKTDIDIIGWEKKEVYIKLTLSSKHPVKETAERGLEDLDYTINVNDKIIEIKNISSNRQHNGKHKFLVEIHVPLNCNVEIENGFGDINVKNITNNLIINNTYGDIDLENLKGLVNIHSSFGDISGNNLKGNFTISANYSDILIASAEGKYDVDLDFGDIHFDKLDNLHGLKIKNSKGDIQLKLFDLNKYNYSLETSFGDISVPEGIDVSNFRKSGFQNKLVSNRNPDFPSININASFGDIDIK